MKCIAFALTLLITATAASSDADSAQSSNLRTPAHESPRQLASRQSDWITSHNTVRNNYQKKYGGTYSKIAWSSGLKNKAATLAKSMANNNCQYQAPSNNDYGINFSRSMGSSAVPSVSGIMTMWEGTLSKGYPANGAMTQVLWSSTKYVGCADAYKDSTDPTKRCYATVCLYAKAGNCNLNNYLPDWKAAVIDGPGCGKCPPNVSSC